MLVIGAVIGSILYYHVFFVIGLVMLVIGLVMLVIGLVTPPFGPAGVLAGRPRGSVAGGFGRVGSTQSMAGVGSGRGWVCFARRWGSLGGDADDEARFTATRHL